ncbi:hypothetical protein OGATHE_004214 [Ogataea polymorpha]|uniref:Uncharacterized protein n=1 Tax=Ogataea polymorpha TaxID=460523 RepID=A0A9P8P0X9_9ASCO|nr:hypothetical protein OGATHE_004214 [Ogataea polymorpha]
MVQDGSKLDHDALGYNFSKAWGNFREHYIEGVSFWKRQFPKEEDSNELWRVGANDEMNKVTYTPVPYVIVETFEVPLDRRNDVEILPSTSFVDFKSPFLQKFHRFESRNFDWHHLVIISMKHPNRYINTLQVFGEVGLGEIADAIESRFEAGSHTLPPPTTDLSLTHLSVLSVEAKKRPPRNVKEKLSPVLVHRFTKTIENRPV